MMSILTVSSLALADDVMFTADDVQSILAAAHEWSYAKLSDTAKSKISEDQWNTWTQKRAEHADAAATAKEEKKSDLESTKEAKKTELEQKKEEKKSELETKKETKKAEFETKKEEKKVEIEQKQQEKKETRSALQQAVLDGDYETFKSLAPADMLEKVPSEEMFMKLSQAYNSKMSNSTDKPEKQSNPKPIWDRKESSVTQTKLVSSTASDTTTNNPAMVERNTNPDAPTKRVKTRRGFWINVPAE